VELIFSYGTLQLEAVQRATFGRLVPTEPDALLGYTLGRVTITDPAVIALSGHAEHHFARPTGRPEDLVEGVVLSVTEAELAAADDYEVDDYTRVSVELASGRTAWLYVDATVGSPG